MARRIAEISFELNRQIALLIGRRGEVEYVDRQAEDDGGRQLAPAGAKSLPQFQ